MKNRNITIGFLSVLFAFPFLASAASVTIDPIPTVCSSAVFRGTASYAAPDTLTVKLNGNAILTSTSGDSTWQVVSVGQFDSGNTLSVEISSTTAGVIASATQPFSANCGSQDPLAVLQVWGLTGHDTPRTPLGATVVDALGRTDTCPIWYPKGADGKGCFDITKTAYYLEKTLRFFQVK
ncbi:MAG: hypothetical protein U1D31_03395 [Patescibacteria group bacterium]|nr:hypothetical protein [Patescibacteria group bacterium]